MTTTKIDAAAHAHHEALRENASAFCRATRSYAAFRARQKVIWCAIEAEPAAVRDRVQRMLRDDMQVGVVAS